MSAISLVCGSNGIVVASDAVAYNDNGVVQAFCSKVATIIEINCFIANIGLGSFAQALALHMHQRAADFDHLLRQITAEAAFLFDYLIKAHNAPDMTATVLLGGWSNERNRFECYKIHSHEKAGLSVKDGSATTAAPWMLHTIEGSYCTNGVDQETMRRFGIDLTAEHTDDAVGLAARLVCAARTLTGKPDQPGFSGKPYAVGGFLQMTAIEHDKITSWVAHRWPDRVGAPVDPNAGEPMPAWLR